MAVVSAEPGQLGFLEARDASPRVLSVSPELVHHVRENDYVRGYADGVADLAGRLGVAPSAAPGTGTALDARPGVQFFRDSAEFTWGIQAVRADSSAYSGAGISVAVLDTGFDPTHPDFAGRAVTMSSFIAG